MPFVVAGLCGFFQKGELMQPLKIEDDIGLFLINFEPVSKLMPFPKYACPFRLLVPEPCKAAEVMARLKNEQFSNHECMKNSLMMDTNCPQRPPTRSSDIKKRRTN